MKRLTLLAVLLLSAPALAQTQVPSPTPATVKLAWDHDGINLDRFELIVDSAAPVDVGKPVPVGTTYAIPFPALTPGNHTLIVRACNIAGCASAAPFPVSVVVVPAVPTSVRIVTS